MSTRRLVTTAIASVVLTTTLALGLACGGRAWEVAGGEAPLALRSFVVSPDLAEELAGVINDSLARGEGQTPVGRASVAPGGRLIVAAPAPILDQVGRMITTVEDASPPPPPVVTLTYWVVEGEPAGETSWSDRLDGLGPVLETIAAADGPSRFRLAEKLRLRSLSGERANAEGRAYSIGQRVAARDGGVVAEVDLRPQHGVRGGSIHTRVQIAPEQTLVLGEAGIAKGGVVTDASSTTLYLVVRAEVEPAGA